METAALDPADVPSYRTTVRVLGDSGISLAGATVELSSSSPCLLRVALCGLTSGGLRIGSLAAAAKQPALAARKGAGPSRRVPARPR